MNAATRSDPQLPGESSNERSTGERDPSLPSPQTTGVDSDRVDRKLVLIAIVVVLGMSLAILDSTVVNVALDTIARRFRAPLPTAQWVVTGYILTLALVIPLTGWAADRFGTRRLFLGAISVFLLGSALSGAASSVGALIAARVLQACGGGMLGTTGMTILTHAAGPRRLGRIMAFAGLPLVIAPVLGPVLGGWTVDNLSWRWIFFINLPVGALALVLGRRVLDTDPGKRECQLDAIGFVLLVAGLLGPILGLVSINTTGGVLHAAVIGPLAGGALALALFVRRSLRIHYPLIDPRLFENRTFAAGSATFFIALVAVFGSLLVLPLYLQSVRGETATQTGLLLTPLGLGAALAIPIAGSLADRVAVGRLVPVGLTLIVVGFVGLTQLGVDTSYWYLGADLAVVGAGIAATMVPMISSNMRSLRKEQVARASTTINIVQQAGAALGTALLSSVLTHELHTRGLGRGGLGGGGSVVRLLTGADSESAARAFATTFAFALPLLAGALIVAIVFLPKTVPWAGGATPEDA